MDGELFDLRANDGEGVVEGEFVAGEADRELIDAIGEGAGEGGEGVGGEGERAGVGLGAIGESHLPGGGGGFVGIIADGGLPVAGGVVEGEAGEAEVGGGGADGESWASKGRLFSFEILSVP